ncbi:MAG: hypothetical protein KJO75_18230 [Dactylosporangium sp.]|nr:hypothetical protein [Dactylosporangium sp.]
MTSSDRSNARRDWRSRSLALVLALVLALGSIALAVLLVQVAQGFGHALGFILTVIGWFVIIIINILYYAPNLLEEEPPQADPGPTPPRDAAAEDLGDVDTVVVADLHAARDLDGTSGR